MRPEHPGGTQIHNQEGKQEVHALRHQQGQIERDFALRQAMRRLQFIVRHYLCQTTPSLQNQTVAPPGVWEGLVLKRAKGCKAALPPLRL